MDDKRKLLSTLNILLQYVEKDYDNIEYHEKSYSLICKFYL